MGSDGSITINRNANIVVAKQPDYIGVSKADWVRLKRKIDCCKNKADWWMNAGCSSLSIAGSTFLSYVTLPLDSDSVWVKPTIICVGIFTFLIGIICLIAHYREGDFYESNINDVKDVIEEIENSLIRIESDN